jgi:2-dehydropantoate 2-reductase
MRIAVVGAGAIGGLLGVKLARSGEDVTFIARGANLAAIREHGMMLVSPDGTQEVAEVGAYEKTAEAGAHDIVFLTLKAHQVAAIAADLAHLCGPQTTIVTMQNGIPWWYFHRHGETLENTRLESVDPGGVQAEHIDPARIIGSVVYPAATLTRPGVVTLIEGNRFGLGEPSGEMSDRVQLIARALIKAGFRAPVTRDIRAEIWLKLWGNVCFNPISALTHATLVEICQFGPTRALAAAAMAEAEAVARKLGIAFKLGIEQRIAGAEKVGLHKTSMLQDVEAGRPLELEALVGSVVELGRLTGTPTLTIEALYACTSLLAKMMEKQRGGLAFAS